jgi:hypothetical protein
MELNYRKQKRAEFISVTYGIKIQKESKKCSILDAITLGY